MEKQQCGVHRCPNTANAWTVVARMIQHSRPLLMNICATCSEGMRQELERSIFKYQDASLDPYLNDTSKMGNLVLNPGGNDDELFEFQDPNYVWTGGALMLQPNGEVLIPVNEYQFRKATPQDDLIIEPSTEGEFTFNPETLINTGPDGFNFSTVPICDWEGGCSEKAEVFVFAVPGKCLCREHRQKSIP